MRNVVNNLIAVARKQKIRRYKTSDVVLSQLEEIQGNRCAICKGDGELVVDHCHETQVVRGLLCRKCNAAIGMLSDSPALLIAAIDYLQNPPKSHL